MSRKTKNSVQSPLCGTAHGVNNIETTVNMISRLRQGFGRIQGPGLSIEIRSQSGHIPFLVPWETRATSRFVGHLLQKTPVKAEAIRLFRDVKTDQVLPIAVTPLRRF